ncbi:MAG TPA: hypothetical protein VIZ65_10340 [Cellvibrionaceae bacterium]
MLMQKIVPILVASIALAACRSGNDRGYHDDSYNSSRGGYSFTSFDLIDTYDVDSRYSTAPYSLDSVNTDGQFKAFWEIRTEQNYEARLFINTAPVISGRRTFGYAFCGGNDVKTCYKSEGTFYCGISFNGTLACDNGSSSQYIDDWLINTHRFYLGLEICSTQGYGCTTKYREVSIY